MTFGWYGLGQDDGGVDLTQLPLSGGATSTPLDTTWAGMPDNNPIGPTSAPGILINPTTGAPASSWTPGLSPLQLSTLGVTPSQQSLALQNLATNPASASAMPSWLVFAGIGVVMLFFLAAVARK